MGCGGKLLKEQDYLLKAWIAIRIVGWCNFSNGKMGKSCFSREGVN